MTGPNGGRALFNENYIAAAEERRARRHEQPAADGQFVCYVCGRSCAGRIGLIAINEPTRDSNRCRLD